MNQQSSSKLEQFFNQFRSASFKKGDIILSPESNPQGVFYLQKGAVRLYSISKTGEELTFNIFKPGSFFSMMYTIGQQPNRYFFEAMTNVKAFNAPEKIFLNFIKENPEILFDLTRRVTIGMDSLLQCMERLAFGKSRNKVASTLTMLAKRFGDEDRENRNIIIRLPVTHQQIANLCGLTRETTSLEMKYLEKTGLIRYEKRMIIVKSIKDLEKEALVDNEENFLDTSFQL